MTDGSWRLDDLLDAPEIAEILHVSSKTVNRLISHGCGELPAVKIGSRWKVRREDLKEYLKKRSGASRNQAFDLSAETQSDTGKATMYSLELQKKRLEVADAALEIATKMVNSLHPDGDMKKKAELIRIVMAELLDIENTQSLERIVQNIPPTSYQ
jgi:excisionase family DNA binding protein